MARKVEEVLDIDEIYRSYILERKRKAPCVSALPYYMIEQKKPPKIDEVKRLSIICKPRILEKCFISATDVNAAVGGKFFANSLTDVADIVGAIEEITGIHKERLFYSREGGHEDTRGVWGHAMIIIPVLHRLKDKKAQEFAKELAEWYSVMDCRQVIKKFFIFQGIMSSSMVDLATEAAAERFRASPELLAYIDSRKTKQRFPEDLFIFKKNYKSDFQYLYVIASGDKIGAELIRLGEVSQIARVRFVKGAKLLIQSFFEIYGFKHPFLEVRGNEFRITQAANKENWDECKMLDFLYMISINLSV